MPFSPVVDAQGNTSKRKVVLSSAVTNEPSSTKGSTLTAGDIAVDSGMASFLFEWPSSFQEMLELSWGKLIFGYALLMTTCVFLFGTAYYILCRSCGADSCDYVGSLFFAVVSLSSNGGYTGEDPIMLTWRTPCFPWRTNIVFIAGLTGACFVSAGAALVVGKASRHTSLRNRIAFARAAVVHRLEDPRGAADAGPLVIQFRVANVHMRPLFHVSVSLTAAVVRQRGVSPDDVAIEVENIPITVSEEHISSAPRDSEERQETAIAHVQRQHELPSPLPCHLWYPITVTHWLEDPRSPLAAMLAAEGGVAAALENGVQFVCQVTGVDPLNGANVVVRKSFNSDNVRIGHRFSDTSLLKSMRTGDGRRHIFVDLDAFNELLVLEGSAHKTVAGATPIKDKATVL